MAIWSQNRSIRILLLLLLCSEFSAVLLAFVGTATVFYNGFDQAEREIVYLVPKGILATTLILISLISMGLYHFHQRLYIRELFARIAVGVVLAALGMAALYFLLPATAMPRLPTTIAIFVAFLSILAIRFYFFHNMDTHNMRRRTLIYGAGERSLGIADLRRRADRRGFVVVATVPANGDLSVSQQEKLSFKSLKEIAMEQNIDEIVIAMDDRRGNFPIRELLDCKLAGINVIDLVEFLERESEKIRIDLVNPSSLIFSPLTS